MAGDSGGDGDGRAALLPSGTVTFLITDIEGSTQLYRRLGDEFEDLLQQHREICRMAFAAHNGSEVACPGDGFIAAFGSAADALAAAVDAQRGLVAHPWPGDAALRVRMGIHAGEARLTNSGGTYLGIGLHEAARVGDAGSGGQIVVSGAAVELIGGSLQPDVDLASLGVHRLRGLDGGHHLYEVRGGGLPSDFPPLRTSVEGASNLPPDPFELFGRTAEVPAVVERVSAHRLTTLLGPGGVGKTRLATVAAGHLIGQFADGCWFVDLSDLTEDASPDDVATVIGAAISVEASHGVAGLAATIASRALLLVLDNCEQVLAPVTEVVGHLLGAGPAIRVLTTSRAPLSLRDEHVLQVAPLAAADAAALFVRRAYEVAPSVTVDPADPDVVHVCDQLDGLPLAIELAAHRIRVLSPRDIARRLDDRFALLTGGPADVDPRQQTLEAAIDWSHDLLDEPERVLLRRLAVFSGGAEPESVEEVCSGGVLARTDVVDVMTALVDRSLVRVDRVGPSVRYGMLRSIHAYAERQLERAGEGDDLRARHLHHFADRSWNALWAMHHGTLADELVRLSAEAGNLRAAIAWSFEVGALDEGLRLACGAGFYGRDCVGGYAYASRGWIEELLERGAGTDHPALRCQALISSANVSASEGDFRRVLVRGEEALALVDQEVLGSALRSQALGMVGLAAEQPHPMRELGSLDRSLLAETSAPAWLLPSRDPRDAIALQEEAAALAETEGLFGFRVWALTNLASAALQVGEVDQARRAGETALTEARRLGLAGGMARALNRLAFVAMVAGDVPLATTLADEAVAAAEGPGATGELAAAHITRAGLAMMQGDTDTARHHAETSADLFASLGHWVPIARSWATGATVYYALGLVDLGLETVEHLLVALDFVGDNPTIPTLVEGLVPAAEAAGHTVEAARLRSFLPSV